MRIQKLELELELDARIEPLGFFWVTRWVSLGLFPLPLGRPPLRPFARLTSTFAITELRVSASLTLCKRLRRRGAALNFVEMVGQMSFEKWSAGSRR